MTKNIIIAILVVIVLGGGWYLYSKSGTPAMQTAGDMQGADMGAYAYRCDNGSGFSMTPASDVSTVTLTGGAQDMFSGPATLTRDASSTTHFAGTVNGAPISFTGAGETMTLSVGSETAVCNPVADPNEAPWNWGDPSDGGAGSVKPDTSLVVTESIQGKWQSTDDAKFVREFDANDKYTDFYDGKVQSSGLWVAFTNANAPKVFPYPMDANTVYLQLTLTGAQSDTLNFKLTKLSPDELQLIYLDRGGALNFKHVK